MEEKTVEGTLSRVDPFQLPIFLYNDAINNEQCEALVKLCQKQEYISSVNASEEIAKMWTGISKDKTLLHGIPDMKQHFELLIQDISTQLLKQVTQGFEIKSSWTTKTEKGQTSKMHMHKNYYLSAILYLQDDNEIILQCPWWDKGNFLFPIYEQTPYTCNSSMIHPPKNSLLIMPSWMLHEIPEWKKEEDRYSIAMNIHPVGEYGTDTSYIEIPSKVTLQTESNRWNNKEGG